MCFLTNFRTPANNQNKNYSSRGHLVIEFVKIKDPIIENSAKKFSNENEYEEMLLNIVTRGFNIVYGNIYTRHFKYF